MKVYRVAICPRCGHIQITSARKSYRCFRCSATIELIPQSIIYESADLSEARRKLLEIKSKRSPRFMKPR